MRRNGALRLPRRMCELLASSYGDDLRDLPITVRNDGPSLARRGVVTLSAADLARPPAARNLVIAHEIAHAVQQRRAMARPNAARRADGEAEASRAALGALAGAPPVELSPLAPHAPAFWGSAGHYYTVYYVLLAAGVHPETARLRALFCQMPDQVSEFDATSACADYHYVIGGAVGFTGAHYYPPDWVPDQRRLVTTGKVCRFVTVPGHYESHRQSADERNQAIMDDFMISAGLHCLTGLKAADETRFRAEVLQHLSSDDHLSVGVALHAYGDSFAHREISRPDYMYPVLQGHAVEIFDGDKAQDVYHSQSKDARMNVTHLADEIANPLRGEGNPIYREYVSSLYRLFAGGPNTPRVSLAELIDDLGPLTTAFSEQGEEVNDAFHNRCIRRLVEKRGKSGQSWPKFLPRYAPEDEPKRWWKDYVKDHLGDLGRRTPAQAFARVYELGYQWWRERGAPKTSGFTTKNDELIRAMRKRSPQREIQENIFGPDRN
ncbi:MAG: hypothetical protein JNK46_12345 [Methylobacteriaceae bacterium]|nr:hypothetical protein [Methylobacteriaceae bacterium]